MMREAAATAITASTIFSTPHVFPDKKGRAVMVRAFEPQFLQDLTRMYLAYEPRGSIGGVPPPGDGDCAAWVARISTGSAALIAHSFDGAVVGHAVLFPMRRHTCELLIVIAPPYQKGGIGTQMMRCIVQLGYELGFARIWLSVHKTNFVALHLYNKFGFECASFTDSPQIDMILDLKRYHPTARIRAVEAMSRQVVAVGQNATCREAAELFLENAVDVLPVVDGEGRLAGILSQTDLIFKLNLHRPVGEIATREVVSVNEQCTLDRVIRLLQTRRLRSIPVIDAQRRVAGMISRRDILAFYFEKNPDL